ncbi:nucleotidyltransferase domain-containing protein [Patulibacter medicamentivorans]|uniref:nucleotidyltransferase domain-containing protein n=1 Tax=Patulibacter medicamentivorans TaxID=1097667 RepID=UPI000590DA3E|nr:nucleotidyltransferase domain-containing protein [Patulibacter medicamentivorans]
MSFSSDSRRTYSEERLAELRDRLSDLREPLATTGLSIYATGSYGRLEAWKESDIDLFFIYENSPDFSYLTFLRLGGRLVEVTEEMEFPPFSGDGKYLESLDAGAMEQILGSRDDDSTNAFTARMLLLLESQPVSDPGRYAALISRVVGFYYRDFEGHESDFVPTFLINDILRFWRTLTLNYEHDRAELGRLEGSEDQLREAKAKSAVKNYKLKLSRLSTCFSMVLHLTCDEPPVTARRVADLCGMTPQERFSALQGRTDIADQLLKDLDTKYEAFLTEVQRPRAELLQSFSDPRHRSDRLAEASTFGEAIYALIRELASEERIRRLVL